MLLQICLTVTVSAVSISNLPSTASRLSCSDVAAKSARKCFQDFLSNQFFPLFFRSVFQIIFYLATTLYYGLPFFGTAGHRVDIALRAIFGTIAAITIYMSYRLIPLADASTIQFSAPVFVFILAYFILGEPVTILHILTGLVALVGVVFVSKPKFILQQFDPDMIANVNYQVCDCVECGRITR